MREFEGLEKQVSRKTAGIDAALLNMSDLVVLDFSAPPPRQAAGMSRSRL